MNEARKFLDEHGIHVAGNGAVAVSHLRRLLAENETRRIMHKEQSHSAETYYTAMKQLEAQNERQMATLEEYSEWLDILREDRAALVAYVRDLKHLFVRFDDYDILELVLNEQWQALGAELQEAIDAQA